MHTATNKNKNQITTHCKKTKKKKQKQNTTHKIYRVLISKNQKTTKKTTRAKFYRQLSNNPNTKTILHETQNINKYKTTNNTTKNKTNKYKNHVTKTNK